MPLSGALKKWDRHLAIGRLRGGYFKRLGASPIFSLGLLHRLSEQPIFQDDVLDGRGAQQGRARWQQRC